jgi:hypothetical protein
MKTNSKIKKTSVMILESNTEIHNVIANMLRYVKEENEVNSSEFKFIVHLTLDEIKDLNASGQMDQMLKIFKDKYKFFLEKEIQEILSKTHYIDGLPKIHAERLNRLINLHCKVLTDLGWNQFHYPIYLTSRSFEQTKALIKAFDGLYQAQHTLLYTYDLGLGKIDHLGMYTEFVNAVLKDIPVSSLGRKRHEFAMKMYEKRLKKSKETLIRENGTGISEAYQHYLYHYNDYLLCKAETIRSRDYDSSSVQKVLMDLSESHQELKKYGLDVKPDYREQAERFEKITGELLKLRPNLFGFNLQPMSGFIVENAIKDLSAIKDLKGDGSYANIKLMVHLNLFGVFLKQLCGRDDWKELLGTFYSLVEKDKVLKDTIDQACLSPAVKEAFGLVDAWYEKQIKLEITKIFKITDEEERKEKLMALLRHPPIGCYIGFLGGLGLTSVGRVAAVHDALSGLCNETLEALSESVKSGKESSDYETYCNKLKDQVYEYTAFSACMFNKSFLDGLIGTTGTAYQERCNFIINPYLDYLSELEKKLEEFDLHVLEELNLNIIDIDFIKQSIMNGRRYFLSNAASCILDNNCLNVNVIQKVLSEFLNLDLSNRNIYISEDRKIFNQLLEHRIEVGKKRQDVKSFILNRAMNFLSTSNINLPISNWYDKDAFELILKDPTLETDFRKLIEESSLVDLNNLERNINLKLASQYPEQSSLGSSNLGNQVASFKQTILDMIKHAREQLEQSNVSTSPAKIQHIPDLSKMLKPPAQEKSVLLERKKQETSNKSVNTLNQFLKNTSNKLANKLNQLLKGTPNKSANDKSRLTNLTKTLTGDERDKQKSQSEEKGFFSKVKDFFKSRANKYEKNILIANAVASKSQSVSGISLTSCAPSKPLKPNGSNGSNIRSDEHHKNLNKQSVVNSSQVNFSNRGVEETSNFVFTSSINSARFYKDYKENENNLIEQLSKTPKPPEHSPGDPLQGITKSKRSAAQSC